MCTLSYETSYMCVYVHDMSITINTHIEFVLVLTYMYSANVICSFHDSFSIEKNYRQV
jgi:hypothetical protein